jgi:hypothetical protein
MFYQRLFIFLKVFNYQLQPSYDLTILANEYPQK